MTTAVRSRRTPRSTEPAFDPVSVFREHIALKTTAAKINTRSDALKKRLKEWMPKATGTYKNENGSIFFDLPETIEHEGVSYSGMELRRSVPVTFDEEKAEAILKRKAKKDPAIIEDAQSSYIDQEKIHRLVAEERLTEKELDEMFVEGESFAFWPIKGHVV